jgi:hypothetical protein
MRSWIALFFCLAGLATAQEEMTIAEMQLPTIFGPDSAGTVGQLVTVEGVALSSSEHFYAGSNSSFYLIDENGGDYSGVLVFKNVGGAFDVFVGDRLRVTGTVAEYRTQESGRYSHMTEIVPNDPSVDVEVLDYEQPLPDPVFVDMWYLDPIRHEDHVAERYEAMLMEIHDAVVVDISAPPSWRQFTVADPEGNRAVIRTAAYGLSSYGRPPLGSTFSMIRGVIYQVYSNYNVMPRDINDLILAVGPPIISGTTIGPCGATPADLIHIAVNISDDTAIDEAFVYYRVNGGAFIDFPLTRDLSNPILYTADLPAQPEGSMVDFYIYAMDDEGNPSHHPADGAGSPSFPQLYVSSVTPTTCLQIQSETYADGASLYQCRPATITGVVTFGYTDFGFTAEDTYRNYIVAEAGGANHAIYIYNNQSHGAWLEQLERGDLVTLQGMVTEYNGLTELTSISGFTLHSPGNDSPVTPLALGSFLASPEPWESVLVELSNLTVTADAGFGEWLVQDGQGNQIILDNLGTWDVQLSVGAHMDGLRGVITYNFNAWKIAPRQNDDFINLSGLARPTRPVEFSLAAAVPNPFNPATTIHYELSRETELRLSVVNLAGQEVALLASGRRPAGGHSVVFDGSRLASGLYLARLEAEGRSSQLKLLLVK